MKFHRRVRIGLYKRKWSSHYTDPMTTVPDFSDVHDIGRVQFSLISPEEIIRNSVVQVHNVDLNEGSSLDTPKCHGVNDPRMGQITDNSVICPTDEKKFQECPGYFGHVILAKPVFWPEFIGIIFKTLKMVCYNCSKILFDFDSRGERSSDVVQYESLMRVKGKSRFEKAIKLFSTKRTCVHCQATQPRLFRDQPNNPNNILGDFKIADGGRDKRINFTPEYVRVIFSRITNEDIERLGFDKKFSRPEWMICTVLPVPPPCIRPSCIRADTGQRSEDDITGKLQEIVKLNKELKRKLDGEASRANIDEYAQLIQIHIGALVMNSANGGTKVLRKSGTEMKSIFSRLQFKTGRIRGNLMGKRSNFCARSVITGDPAISVEEVGVPVAAAMKLTYPQIVTPLNHAEMLRLVKRGPAYYPGAVRVLRGGDESKLVILRTMWKTNRLETFQLEIGDVVERHIRNGDYVLFNRQPSLHKHSMQAHKVRIMEGSTFRLQLAVVAPYNADFDGDEMNLLAFRNPETMMELEALCRVPVQIISPQSSSPVIGICQDSLVGAYLITGKDIKMTYAQFQQIMMRNTGYIGIMPEPDKNGMYDGRMALSTIFPPLDKKWVEDDGKHIVEVRDGEIVHGRLTKTHLGATTDSFVQVIHNDFGPDDALKFLDNEQSVVNDWLMLCHGFSVGLSDCILPASDRREVKDVIELQVVRAREILDKAHNGTLESKLGRGPVEEFEIQILAILNKTEKETKTDKRVGIQNRFRDMISASSKGSKRNLVQIMSCIGQVHVAVKQPDRSVFRQSRIPYNDGKMRGGYDGRTLPHFHRHDDSPRARGFCSHSFLNGLDPHEFFFHNSSGREGLIDTAIKSVTGDTPIVLIEKGIFKRIEIGSWIDDHLARHQDDIERLPEKDQELLRLRDETFIPTCDDHGNVTWARMTAVTRHDPGNILYEITTFSGRSVKVVESKSLIVWDGENFVEKPSAALRIGDLLPVTADLPEPPVIISHFDMSSVFPKERYLFESESDAARKLYDEMGVENGSIPEWWSEHNGSKFNLPYSNFQIFTVMKKSCGELREGCVYPIFGYVGCGHIPARFPLNVENGRFLGLYLAEGRTNKDAGSIRIGRCDKSIGRVVQSWFEDHEIRYTKEASISTTDSDTCDITGYSQILLDFLDKSIGQLAQKIVPDFSFTAPEEFVVGLLSGYFSACGCIESDDNSIVSSSSSARIIEGVSLLCTRLGIFAKTSTKDDFVIHSLTIESSWSKVFSEKIGLVDESKQRQLDIFRTKQYVVCPNQNDVTLDSVTEIVKLDAIAYPKVYDVTVPTTLNFALANGLNVRDTSETGYLQKRCIKLMEDGKVYYDGTVRSNSRLILQYSYGSDGFDAIKLERDTIFREVIQMTDSTLGDMYFLSANEDFTRLVDAKVRTAMKKDKGLDGLLYDEWQSIVDIRSHLRNEIFKFPIRMSTLESTMISSIESQMPVNFKRMIESCKTRFRVGKKLSDLNPRYIVERIKDLLAFVGNFDETASDYVKNIDADNTILQRYTVQLYLSSRRVLNEYRLTKDMFDDILQTVRDKFSRSVVHPGEMVGVLAAQSLGQPTTQMTLNSVHYDTELLIEEDGKLIRTTIGDYVEKHIEDARDYDGIDEHPNDTILAHMPYFSNHRILSCDEDGKLSWQRIEAVTRHPVVNEDGSNDVIRVKTKSGREVVATRGKSFLTRRDNKILPTEGKDLEVGMFLPISAKLPIEVEMSHVEVSDYLSKSEFIFMSEVHKALEYRNTESKHWWLRGTTRNEDDGSGPAFVLPYERSDALVEAFIGSPRNPLPKRRGFCNDNCVYPRTASKAAAHIPERIVLDNDFGFFVGAYLAEGGCTAHHLMISNLDDDFNDRIIKYCATMNLKYHIQEGPKNGGYSKTIRTHSLVFTKLFCEMFGNGAANKRVHASLLSAPDIFLKGLIDGYFCGDGTVNKKSAHIGAASISEPLLQDIRQILSRFSISSKLTRLSQKCMENLRKRQPNARQGWNLHIQAAECMKFQKTFDLTLRQKSIYLKQMTTKLRYDVSDIVPNIIHENGQIVTKNRSYIHDLSFTCENFNDRRLFQNILDEEIRYDEILSIDRITHDRPWIYDLTIEKTRNFSISNGLHIRDTFHAAGSATQFNTVDGVPRLEELLGQREKPKAPSITIYLKDRFREDEERADIVKNKLRQTRISDITRMSEIVYDPDDKATNIAGDKGFLDSYYSFMEEEDDCTFDFPWVLRMEFDREKMLERDIHMWEIHKELLNRFSGEIHCVFADDNADMLTMRVRPANDPSNDKTNTDSDIIFLLKNLEKAIMESVALRGINGVRNAFLPARETRPRLTTIGEDGGIDLGETRREVVIVAELSEITGRTLFEVFKIPEVDETRTFSNHVAEIFKLLGIEAARNLLMRELYNVFSKGGDVVKLRHLEMLVDTMTCTGKLTKINRQGIHDLRVGPLARVSFEDTRQNFWNAAAFAEHDEMRGVSGNTMVGQYFPGGTGECEILFDEEMQKEKPQKSRRLTPVREEDDAVPDLREDEESDEHDDVTDLPDRESADGAEPEQATVELGFDFELY